MTRALAVAALVALAGCQCSQDSSQTTTSDNAAGSSGSAAATTTHKHPVHRVDKPPPTHGPKLAALTIAALQPYLPQLGDELVPLSMSADGKRVQGAYCVSAPDVRAAADQLATDLANAGWSGAEARGEPPTTGVSADRDGLHFSVVLRGSDIATCPQAQHRFAANVTAFKLEN